MTDLLLLIPMAALTFTLWHAARRYDAAEQRWAKERSELLTRIQAPEMAPTLSSPDPSDEPIYVSPSLDEDWDDYVEARKAGEVT